MPEPPCASSPTADRSTASVAATTALSHELRTPLNAILGNLGLLLDGTAGPLSSEARACLGDIQRGARQLLDRVQSLLDEVERAGADQPEPQTAGADRAAPLAVAPQVAGAPGAGARRG